MNTSSESTPTPQPIPPGAAHLFDTFNERDNASLSSPAKPEAGGDWKTTLANEILAVEERAGVTMEHTKEELVHAISRHAPQSQSKAEAVGEELTVKKSRQQLARSLRWLANLVQQGDNDEATISFEVGDGDYFDVASSFHYRAGKGLNYSWRFGPGDVDEPRPPATKNPPENAKGEGRRWLDGAPPSVQYQPQHVWSDGDFDLWVNLGEPTSSKRIARERMTLYLDIHKETKPEQARFIEITSSSKIVSLAVEPTPSTREEGRKS